MKRRLLTFLLVFLFIVVAILASACGKGIQAGEVYKKRHEEAYTTVVFVPIQTGQVCSGSPPICTPIMTPFPFFWEDNEDWVLSIRSDEGETNDLYVSREDWESTAVGDHVDYSGDEKAGDDANNKRTPKEDH